MDALILCNSGSAASSRITPQSANSRLKSRANALPRVSPGRYESRNQWMTSDAPNRSQACSTTACMSSPNCTVPTGASGSPCEGSLERLKTPTQGLPDAPVGTVQFGEDIQAVVEQACDLLGASEVIHWLRDSYRPGETLGSAFARLFSRLFADWGVILLDAADPELHKISASIYQA